MIKAVYPVNARLTEAQGKALVRAAHQTGLSISTLIREAVERAYVEPERSRELVREASDVKRGGV